MMMPEKDGARAKPALSGRQCERCATLIRAIHTGGLVAIFYA
jgi:hypothetical protein